MVANALISLPELDLTQTVFALEAAVCTPLLIALGAIFGALSRYYLTLLAAQHGTTFPYGTLCINLTGCGLMGFLSHLVANRVAAVDWQAVLIIGFLGSYTTFSTYALDTSNLLRTGKRKRALLYGFGSPILGFLGVELGLFLAQQIV
ncbi:fluoride efflux transporter CrcB [Oculatella sp. LEGE 06141]|uniref:fluoride efflux transporter CrcB n=1 Tax=Oculatella sp. LEGE 06141 TaxID=1828648 RepID=UPI001882746A|nr:fluoride efflux transporter CrcB [Oculatella sp. LEGE 06141]MBE9180709.1 fluoride efflux transporter CrcB [Oculatella sp. LEGE 06141]